MLILPSVDIKNGRCVRLTQGDASRETVYENDPLKAALRWKKEGSDVLHVVDLDGAFEGMGVNGEQVKRILAGTGLKVELGGGIRTASQVKEWLGLGVSLVVLGTWAVEAPEAAMEVCRQWPGRIVIAVDARNGLVATHGWTRISRTTVTDFARGFDAGGPAAFLYTDIEKDGMLSRPNFEATRKLVESVEIPVIASGGVTTIEDVKRLGEIGACAVIIGKALYDGRAELWEAVSTASEFKQTLVVP